jgi:hypothetical protein
LSLQFKPKTDLVESCVKQGLLVGVVFLFIANCLFSQSKKEQIDVLLSQRDSLIKIISQKDVQITALSEQNLSQSNAIKQTEERNRMLVDQLTEKDKQINELIAKKNCLSAKTVAEIEIIEGLEPMLVLRSFWNGFSMNLEQEGENETYPNRLYSFRYSFDNMEVDLPAGSLFNEKRNLLQKRLNEWIKKDLTEAGIPPSQIIEYSFPVDKHESGDGDIMFFIEHDRAIFYFEQYIYGINDRREIEIPLSELNEYLINLKDLSIEERRKYCSNFNTQILIQVLLKNVEEGDAGYYLEFVDPISEEIFQFSFAEWQFEDQLIEDFCNKYWVNGLATEKEFIIELKWSKIMEYEYRGFDIGNVETGKFIDAWTLVSIYPGWTK